MNPQYVAVGAMSFTLGCFMVRESALSAIAFIVAALLYAFMVHLHRSKEDHLESVKRQLTEHSALISDLRAQMSFKN